MVTLRAARPGRPKRWKASPPCRSISRSASKERWQMIDIVAVDFSPITPERLPAIIDAVEGYLHQIKEGSRDVHAACENVLRLMAKLEGGAGLSTAFDAPISREFSSRVREAIVFLFDDLKRG